MLDAYRVKEYIDDQECIIRNLIGLFKQLLLWKYLKTTTVPKYPKQHEILSKLFDITIQCLRDTSGYEGPEGEQWADWGGDEHTKQALIEKLQLAIDKASNRIANEYYVNVCLLAEMTKHLLKGDKIYRETDVLKQIDLVISQVQISQDV